MIHPLFAEDLQPEFRPLEIARFRTAAESMRGRAEADHRLARIQGFREVRELIVRQLTEARPDDEQVRRVERLRAGDVFLEVAIDVTAVRIDRKEHGAVEAMLLA